MSLHETRLEKIKAMGFIGGQSQLSHLACHTVCWILHKSLKNFIFACCYYAHAAIAYH